MIYTINKDIGETFDAEILRQELVAALGPADVFPRWCINTYGNSVEFSGEGFSAQEDLAAPVIQAHFSNTAARAAAKAAAEALKVEDATAVATVKLNPVIQYLATHTPAECAAYVQTNVTDLASAKTLLKHFAEALCVLSRKEFR